MWAIWQKHISSIFRQDHEPQSHHDPLFKNKKGIYACKKISIIWANISRSIWLKTRPFLFEQCLLFSQIWGLTSDTTLQVLFYLSSSLLDSCNFQYIPFTSVLNVFLHYLVLPFLKIFLSSYAFIDRTAKEWKGNREERDRKWHAAKGPWLKSNPGVLQRRHSLCTRGTRSTNWATRAPHLVLL